MSKELITDENCIKLKEHFQKKPVPITLIRLLFDQNDVNISKHITQNEKLLYATAYLYATSDKYLGSSFGKLISEALKFYITENLSSMQVLGFKECFKEVELITGRENILEIIKKAENSCA